MSIGSVSLRLVSVIGVILLTCPAPPVFAQGVGTFYKGKRIDVIIATPPGGGYDAYARLLMRHIGHYVPGQPAFIGKNMPGASGTKALEFLHNMAPKDGTTIGAVHPGNLLEPLLALSNKRVDYNSQRFSYIGSANVETSLCILTAQASVKTFQDAYSHEAILGGSGTSTVFFPSAHNSLLGTRFKIVSGYSGTASLNLAMQRGEIDGFCGQFWSSLNMQHPDWITNGEFNIIVQEAAQGRYELDQIGVPLVYKFAKSEADAQAMDLLYLPLTFGRPYLMPPEVPEDRVRVLRTAFDKVTRDPALLADARKLRLPIEPISGGAVQKLVMKLFTTPPEVVQRLKNAMPKQD